MIEIYFGFFFASAIVMAMQAMNKLIELKGRYIAMAAQFRPYISFVIPVMIFAASLFCAIAWPIFNPITLHFAMNNDKDLFD